MSKAVSLRLNDEQIARLDRAAEKARLSRSEMAATLLEIALRMSEFPYIEFKDFGAGLEAFVSGTRLRVWFVTLLVRDYKGDIAKVAEHLNLHEGTIKAVINYTDAFPEDIEAAIRENDRAFDDLERRFPNLKVTTVDLTAADAPAP